MSVWAVIRDIRLSDIGYLKPIFAAIFFFFVKKRQRSWELIAKTLRFLVMFDKNEQKKNCFLFIMYEFWYHMDNISTYRVTHLTITSVNVEVNLLIRVVYIHFIVVIVCVYYFNINNNRMFSTNV